MAHALSTVETIADGQADGQWQTSNDADAAIANALADIYTVDFSGGNVTLTSDQFCSAMTFVPSGLSTNRDLTIPAVKRAVFIVNNIDAADTITVKQGSTSIAVAATKIGVFSTTGAANNLTGTILSSGSAGDVVGPASVTDGNPAVFDGTTGKLIKQQTFTQLTASLIAMVGDSGAGGTKGLVPAPASGDAAAVKFLKADGTWAIPAGSGVSTGRTLTAGAGLTGGGDLSADRTFDVGAGTGITVNANDVALDTSSARNTDHSGVTLTAGAGLTGGGDISASRSFAVGAGTGITVNADDVQIATAYQAIGVQTIWVPAGAMVADTTNGPSTGTVQPTSHGVIFPTLDFDTSTIEYAQFQIRMPKGWNESTITYAYTWSHAATVTNFAAIFKLDAVACSDDDAGDASFGTAVSVTDTGGTTNDIYVSSTSSAVTIAGTPAAEDLVIFRVYRDASNGSDTLAVDARLHGVTIYYTIDAANDA